MVHVRPYTSSDRTFILNLAPRLAIGPLQIFRQNLAANLCYINV